MSSIKVALYIRVSTEDQVKEGYSLDAQKRRLYEFCNQNNYEVYKLYADEGISGHSISKRKAFQEMIKDAKQKKFSVVIAYKTDRLSRNLLDLLVAKQELDNADVELILSDESIDTKDDTGVAMFSIMGAFAELERKKITERMMSGKRQKILNESKMPRIPQMPYGYYYQNEHYYINEDEAYYVRLIFNLFSNGASSYEVARYLLENNIKPINKNNYLSSATLLRISKNPIYKGYGGISYSANTYFKKIQNEPILIKCNNVDPIVSEDLWDKVNFVRKSRTKSKKPVSPEFIFSNVIRCAMCGWRMQTHISNYNRIKRDGSPVTLWYSYKCTQRDYLTTKHTCPMQHIGANKVEAWFVEYLNTIKITSSTIRLSLNSTKEFEAERDRLLNNKLNVAKKQKLLLQKLLDGIINDTQYQEVNNDLQKEIALIVHNISELDKKIDNATADTLELENLKNKVLELKKVSKKWQMLTPLNKKLVVDTFIKSIYVNRDGITKIEFK